MFSKSCEYAFRAVIFLSSQSAVSPIVKIQEIAESINAPMHYASKVLQQLSKAGLIGSVKGPGGGFFIDNTHAKVRLVEIVKVIDGDKVFKGCAIGLIPCSEKNPCLLHDEFKVIRNKLAAMLTETSIKDITEDIFKNGLKPKVA